MSNIVKLSKSQLRFCIFLRHNCRSILRNRKPYYLILSNEQINIKLNSPTVQLINNWNKRYDMLSNNKLWTTNEASGILIQYLQIKTQMTGQGLLWAYILFVTSLRGLDLFKAGRPLLLVNFHLLLYIACCLTTIVENSRILARLS